MAGSVDVWVGGLLVLGFLVWVVYELHEAQKAQDYWRGGWF